MPLESKVHPGYNHFVADIKHLKPPRVTGLLRRTVSTLLTLVVTLGLPALAQTNAHSPFAVADEAAFFQLLDLTRTDLVTVSNAVQAGDWNRAKAAWAAHLEQRTTPVWLWSRRERTRIEALYQERFNGLARHTNAANLVLARDFNLLGVRKELKHKIEWLQGPIEWTHVLSRFQYWNDLGRAYWATSHRAYAADFVFQLKDWVAANPVPTEVSNLRGDRGSVWRTLETGIRAQGWFNQLEFFIDAPEFDSEARYIFTKSLVEHANYLTAHTTAYRPGNWQVCEASGLATVGIMLPEFKAAAQWRQTGLNMLAEHMRRDVEPDGFHWELTPGYHRWVMLQFLQVSRLCELNGIPADDLHTRHEKMFEVLQKLRRPDGTYPPVGDAGRGSDIGELMGLGALLYQRPDFRYFAATNAAESWIWSLGPDAVARLADTTAAPPEFTSVLLPDSQYAIMRSGWGPHDKYLLFDCAPWRGAHSHQDRLQVTLFAGRDLIVDGGQISYDQPESKLLRQAAAHNVLLLDGEAQLEANPELTAWHTDTEADFASGTVGANGIKHQRSVLFVKPAYWVVADQISGAGKHEVTRLFHFPVGKIKSDKLSASTTFPDGMNVRVQIADDGQIGRAHV